MQNRCVRQGFNSFFLMLPDALVADALHYIQLYELVSQKAQRPTLPPLRRFAASELDETRLSLPIDFRHFQRTPSGIHRGADPLDCTSFAYTLDRADVYIEMFCNFLVCQALIRLKQNPRMLHFER